MNTPIFRQIPQRNVDNDILQSLRHAIISGQVTLGSHLNETEIAKQMAVSRIPIREALRKLEQEGLVVRQPNRGVFVTKFTEKDVNEVFSLRSNLESMAFKWAIPNMTETDFKILRDLIKQQETAIQNKDFDELAGLDMLFHQFICEKANHSRLLKSWQEQHAQCQMLLNLRFRHMSEYTPETVTEDHAEIMDAIEQRDIDKVIALTLEISERVSAECSQTVSKLIEGAKTKEVPSS